jgi:hypothetical protein
MDMKFFGALYRATANFFCIDAVPLITKNTVSPLSPVVSTDQLIISASMKVHPQVLYTYNTCAYIISNSDELLILGFKAKIVLLGSEKRGFLSCFASKHRNSKNLKRNERKMKRIEAKHEAKHNDAK